MKRKCRPKRTLELPRTRWPRTIKALVRAMAASPSGSSEVEEAAQGVRLVLNLIRFRLRISFWPPAQIKLTTEFAPSPTIFKQVHLVVIHELCARLPAAAKSTNNKFTRQTETPKHSARVTARLSARSKLGRFARIASPGFLPARTALTSAVIRPSASFSNDWTTTSLRFHGNRMRARRGNSITARLTSL